MSTTGPVIWITRPVAGRAAVAISFSCLLKATRSVARRFPSALARLRAGRDLDQLSGDVGLAGLVVAQREVLDQLVRILRGVLHGDHLAREEARTALKGGLEEPGAQVARQQLAQDLRRSRLAVHLRAGDAVRVGAGHDGQQLDLVGPL